MLPIVPKYGIIRIGILYRNVWAKQNFLNDKEQLKEEDRWEK